MMTDQQLLREFAEHRSEQAFESLVQRHVDLVFAAAVRQVGQTQAAQEITQNVFVALARKAAWLRGYQALSSWLYKTTLLEARQWWRGEYRRQHREQTAAELGTTMKQDDSLSQSLAGILDEGLMQLREPERHALLLRFFEDRTHRDIGLVLGVREDAVRKRIDKALEHLTDFFRRRGYAVPATTAAATLKGAAQTAPLGLSASATQAALSATVASGTGVSLTFAKLMGLTKTQTALVCATLAMVPIAYQGQAGRTLRQERAKLTEMLQAQQQTLLATQNQQADLLAQSRQLRDAVARLKSRPGTSIKSSAQANAWNEDAPYVQLPKAMLARIQIPAIGNNGLLEPDMARALGLHEQQVATANRALASFSAQYHHLEAAHSHLTDDHPTSMHVSAVVDQKTLLCEAFPQDYQSLMTELKTTLKQTLGEQNCEYFWTNTPGAEHEEFDMARGPLAKRVTLFRSKDPGPYFMGEEYQFGDGTWGSAHFGPVEDETQIPFSRLAEIFAEWKRDSQPVAR